MNRCAIVIPIYKNQTLNIEELSLKQCSNILGKYPIIFVTSESLDTSYYENFCNLNNIQFNVQRFNDKYFESVISYSKLLLNKKFYKCFVDYEFMLIYQLDAWVFEDKLEYWCNQNYDYIGAPWFEDYDLADEKSLLLPLAGNGGFSLRKVSSILKVLNTDYRNPKSFKYIYEHSSKRRLISKIINTPIYLFRYVFQVAHLFPLWRITELYEDITFARYGEKAYSDFKLAPPEVALQFSFETQPKRLYEMNNNQLPFGCHAFEKYDFKFWKQFINVEKN